MDCCPTVERNIARLGWKGMNVLQHQHKRFASP